ncbi:TnsD family Tn7-like transposition protein [Rhodoferax ferrireducens]|nr:TnsD family Tn7-like transposition protein [Rhodoferax ferrireducens]
MGNQPRYWQLPRITQWLPRETVYSLASRHHQISCNFLPSQTSQQLFGHGRQGSMHDIPSRIDEFVIRTEGILGDADSVIRGHTLLPFYLPYRTESDSVNAIAGVRHGGIGGLKGRLGILASRFGASHPLKACSQCILEDQVAHQVAYWHTDHQWPGTWVCLKHQLALNYALYKVNAEGRFHWCLPLDVIQAPGIDAQRFEESRDILTRLSECAEGLGTLPKDFHFLPTRLAATYQKRLHELGCYGPTARLKSKEFLQLLEVVCSPLSCVHGLGILRGDDVPLLNQFARLIDEHRGVAHPLKHFVISLALFNNWTAFVGAYEAAQSGHERNESDVDTLANIDHALINTQKVALIESVKNGQSVTAASKEFGVAVATAMAWAAEAGLHTPWRAKIFSSSRRKCAMQMLRDGKSKEDVAATASVSIQSITLLLRTQPGLRADWNQAKFDRTQKESRTSWTQMAQRLHPISGRRLRQLQPAIFAWLYRNDRNWLEDFNAKLPQSVKTNNSNIRWDARDANYSQGVDAAALAVHLARPGSRIRLADLCNRIPELKARLSNLDQLPLTHAAIGRATRRHATD